jgi:hypothetical protein
VKIVGERVQLLSPRIPSWLVNHPLRHAVSRKGMQMDCQFQQVQQTLIERLYDSSIKTEPPLPFLQDNEHQIYLTLANLWGFSVLGSTSWSTPPIDLSQNQLLPFLDFKNLSHLHSFKNLISWPQYLEYMIYLFNKNKNQGNTEPQVTNQLQRCL